MSRKSPQRWWRRIVRGMVLAACLAYLISFLLSNQEELFLAFEFAPTHLMAVAGLLTVYYFVYSYRFQFVVEVCSKRQLKPLEWFKLIVVGRFLNGLFPQVGNLYRTVRLKESFGVTHIEYVTALLSYMWLDMLMNFIVAWLLVVAFDTPIMFWGYPAATVLVVLLLFGTATPWFLDRLLAARDPGDNHLGRLERLVHAMIRGAVDYARHPRHLAVFGGLGLGLFGLMAAVLYLLFLGLGAELDVATLAVFYALYRLTVYVTITPGNFGVRELAYGILGDELGVGMVEAVVVALVLRVVSYLVLAVLGVMVGGVDALRSRRQLEGIKATLVSDTEFE